MNGHRDRGDAAAVSVQRVGTIHDSFGQQTDAGNAPGSDLG